MIPISLPSGKVVFVTFEQSLDEGFLNDLIADDQGCEIDDPFDVRIDKIRDESSWNVPEVPGIPNDELKKIKKEIKRDL